MRDFLPDDVRRRAHVIGVVEAVYGTYGFEPLETPAVENLETLTGKYGEEGDRLIFKILERGEGASTGAADLALRYDLTVPLSRVVAEHRGRLPRFFKRYQIQPVWRADRPQRGRFREFYQCDVDVIGSRSLVVEAEILAAAADVLDALGFPDFVIRLNHRQLLTGLLVARGIEAAHHAGVLVAIDKFDKIGGTGVRDELQQRGLAFDVAEGLLADVFPGIEAGDPDVRDHGSHNRAILDRLRGTLSSHPAAAAGLADLGEIVRLAEATSAGPRLRLDPSLARGLSYYTGAIMEITVADLSGSLGGGGRYDDLIGMFLGQDVPACGFSLGLERLIVVMTERDMFPATLQRRPADVMVALWNAAGATEALALARVLRGAGLRVDVYPEADKVGRQFKYAAGRGVPIVALRGEDEIAHGTVAVKDLRTGEQQSVPRPHVAAHVQALLATPRPSSSAPSIVPSS
jgi:histidyl-tRNA synthetase